MYFYMTLRMRAIKILLFQLKESKKGSRRRQESVKHIEKHIVCAVLTVVLTVS